MDLMKPPEDSSSGVFYVYIVQLQVVGLLFCQPVFLKNIPVYLVVVRSI